MRSEILGAQLRLVSDEGELIKAIGLQNPDFCNEHFYIDSEFAFMRLKFFDNFNTLLAESWVKPELVQMSDLKEFEIFDELHDSFNHKVLYASVRQILNSQRFKNFVDYVNMPIEKSCKFFYQSNKIFAPTDIFKGFTVAAIY